MEEVHFIIPGRPVGKGRPRFTKNGHCWTPDRTVAYEREIKLAYWEDYGRRKFSSDKALAVTIVLYYVRPKSMTKAKRLLAQRGILRPIVKPDVDNVVKAILDALNGVAFEDDRQIVQVECEKWYDITEENEGFAYVTIKGWDYNIEETDNG
ncbi:RusA family crossover junction endodeoxyribonuclease [Allisonella histaminiformans]|uniref:RusA family crossover junction endodeoxyribonuclease n=1 Tax=Allisonella histaminiformans TaxID=209880 RepID=UPI0022E4A707|nr:RusA family crossover junction endodeoxyribonuclease [Allisonella histaminiformans]